VSDNRRIQTRHDVSLPGTLTIDGSTSDCTVVNLSLGGALVAAHTKYPMGSTAAHLVLGSGAAPRDRGGRNCTVVEHRRVGVQFDGLRARDVWAISEFFKQLLPH